MCFRSRPLHWGSPKEIIWQWVTVDISVLAWWHEKYLECFIINEDAWVSPRPMKPEPPRMGLRNVSTHYPGASDVQPGLICRNTDLSHLVTFW